MLTIAFSFVGCSAYTSLRIYQAISHNVIKMRSRRSFSLHSIVRTKGYRFRRRDSYPPKSTRSIDLVDDVSNHRDYTSLLPLSVSRFANVYNIRTCAELTIGRAATRVDIVQLPLERDSAHVCPRLSDLWNVFV